MTVNWNNIRPLGGSLNDGFEELVCQLAAREIINDAENFVRAGKPDAGKECYWKLKNGDLHMWQAKYFTNSPAANQWAQIEESVKRALENHTNIVRYYVCLPADLPDAKIKGRKSALDKWQEKVGEWKEIALDLGMQTEFIYWGSSELVTRLSRKENEGLLHFWFNKEEFLDEWFNSRNDESISALGARYTPEINIELEISKLFEGMSRSSSLKKHGDAIYRKVFENYHGAKSAFEKEEVKILFEDIEAHLAVIKKTYHNLNFEGNVAIEIDPFVKVISVLMSIVQKAIATFYSLRDEKEKNRETEYYNRPYSAEINSIHNFNSSLKELLSYFKGPALLLADSPYLILTGEAGIGKSHLLADIVNKRKEQGLISLFLLGENFSNREQPWTQILYNQLRKNSLDEFVFLDALNSKAESMQKRIIIFIDALNEGEGRYVWPGKIKYFIKSIQKFPWLGLVATVRDSYEQLIVPEEEITEDLILRVEHHGFADYEYTATRRFFQYYGIMQPASPLLSPEFHNPLFLKLFCKSLQTKGLTQVPDGYEGITNIINFYLDAVNQKFSQPDQLHYDTGKRLVHQCVDKAVKKMIKDENDFITYLQADKIADKVFGDKCYRPEPFLKKLISEGVFNLDLKWTDKGNHFEVVYFGYQRFQDHLIVSSMLDKFLDPAAPVPSFKSGRLSELIKDEKALQHNRNFIEALAIQIPERTGKELFEVAPEIIRSRALAQAWINSLLWRKTDNIGASALDYVNKVVVRQNYLFNNFLYTVISSAMKSDFRFNADSLHKFLLNFELSGRDHFWTVWLQDKYGNQEGKNPVSRLIDWAWNEDDKSYASTEALTLGATALAWFLTSANRTLRDAATKALVCLFESRPSVISEILQKFKEVNDPYVIERIYAAAYGAVTRSDDFSSLESLAEKVFKNVFSGETVYPHILLRDYARGIIEFALANKIPFKGDVKKVRPPYKSEQLPSKFPSNEEIDSLYNPDESLSGYGKENWGSTAIISSMTTEYGRGTGGYGDFGRYTFQSGLRNFEVDADGLSNYAIQRIFELGYDPKLFTDFDASQGNDNDGCHKERIGKKYQWIAFYEVLAKVSDHASLQDSSGWRGEKKVAFGGPWYPYVRDIDPTVVIKETKAVQYDQAPFEWWFKDHSIHLDMPVKKWLSSTADIPLGPYIIQVTDQEKNEWLWLESNPVWIEKESLEEDRYNSPRKKLSLWVTAYIVRNKDKEKMMEGLRSNVKKDLPQTRSMYSVFSREYYWSKAFKFFEKPYYTGQKWIEVYDNKNQSCGEVHRTAEYFLWEEEFDCSKNEAIVYYKPTDLIFEGLKLKFAKKEGELVNDSGELICFDPSVYNTSFRGLLVRKDVIENWLSSADMSIIWSVVGEKIILGSPRKIADNGRLTIAGYYELENGIVKGSMKIISKE